MSKTGRIGNHHRAAGTRAGGGEDDYADGGFVVARVPLKDEMENGGFSTSCFTPHRDFSQLRKVTYMPEVHAF